MKSRSRPVSLLYKDGRSPYDTARGDLLWENVLVSMALCLNHNRIYIYEEYYIRNSGGVKVMGFFFNFLDRYICYVYSKYISVLCNISLWVIYLTDGSCTS